MNWSAFQHDVVLQEIVDDTGDGSGAEMQTTRNLRATDRPLLTD